MSCRNLLSHHHPRTPLLGVRWRIGTVKSGRSPGSRKETDRSDEGKQVSIPLANITGQHQSKHYSIPLKRRQVKGACLSRSSGYLQTGMPGQEQAKQHTSDSINIMVSNLRATVKQQQNPFLLGHVGTVLPERCTNRCPLGFYWRVRPIS